MAAKALTDPPDDFNEQEKIAVAKWARIHTPELSSRAHLRFITDETFDWHRSMGLRRKDWMATVRNRLRALHAQGRDPLKRISGEPQNDDAQRLMDQATRKSQLDVMKTQRERREAYEAMR